LPLTAVCGKCPWIAHVDATADMGSKGLKLGEKIASELRDEIIAGNPPPGTALRLLPLAERLNVSTTPVREALAILERQGLLSSELHRGFRVVEISARDIGDIYALHAFISELLVERVTRRLTEEDIDELEQLDDAMRDAAAKGDARLAADLNHSFHRRLNLAARSPLLVRFLAETTPFVTRRHRPLDAAWDQHPLEGHHEIIEALRRRDAPEAARLMGTHIRTYGKLAQELAESRAERAAR